MAADPWKKYDSFPYRMAGKFMDFQNDAFKMALFTSASNASDPTKSVYSDLTGEVAAGFGYTTGGVALSGVTLSVSGATVKWTSGNGVWTASGGAIVCRYATIYDTTTGDLVCWSLLNNTPADVTATSVFTVQIATGGIYIITGMS
ncbi:MAG TPA: hypothetical protein VJQ59_16720 [Candidatus Sulfotelmatobacter sp.]|nr:hypothetical protein [Candidatus Sulfotelmatobacter sp.]